MGSSWESLHRGRKRRNRGEWWPGTESNCRHGDFQSPALPTELPGLQGFRACASDPGGPLNRKPRIKPRTGPKVNRFWAAVVAEAQDPGHDFDAGRGTLPKPCVSKNCNPRRGMDGVMNSEMVTAQRRFAFRMTRIAFFAAAAVLWAAGIAACSATPREEPPSYGNWPETMGEAVDRVRFSHLIDWQPLDREWIMLEFSDGRVFALEVRDPCITDTREASSLELDTAMKNTLHRSDRVQLDEYRCLIETIRPLNPAY